MATAVCISFGGGYSCSMVKTVVDLEYLCSVVIVVETGAVW